MPKSFLAIITPVDTSAHPEHPIVIPPDQPPPEGEKPPSIWPGIPTHPIVIPEPPNGGPPILVVPHPEHPIVLPLPPLPDPPHPEHPIVLPPPDWKPPEGTPPGIWGGGNEGFPTPPIVIPPEEKPDKPKLINWSVVWTPKNGWQVVGTPNVPHPAPSKK